MSTGLYSGVSGLALGTGLYKNVSGLWGGASGLINGFGGGSPFGGASLYLNFLAGAPLDSRVTFSRGSNATLVDSTGKITYAPANLVFNSADVTNASWNKLSGGTAASATTFNFTSTFGSGFENQTAVTLAAGTNVVASFFASGSGTIQIGIVDGSGAFGSTFTTVVLTGTLTRYSVSRTLVDANALLRVRNTSGVAVTGATCTQMQLEPVTYQTTPSTYVATTTAAYYGPRFDYDPVTLAAKGLLIEEQRTNLVTGSADFTSTYWPVATNAVVTANDTTSPDGTTNADKLADNTTAGVQHRLYRDYTFTAASHTLSVFAKRNDHRWLRLFFFDGTTSFFGNFDLLNGAVGNKQASTTTTITSFGNGWYRCTMTATTAAAAGNIQMVMLPSDDTAVPVLYTGTGTSLWLFGAQLEAGAFATSYIPTVASQVTRSADVATMTGTNFSSWYNQPQGTLVADFTPDTTITGNRVVAISSTGTTERTVDINAQSGNWVNYNGAAQTTIGPASITSNPQKIAVAYASANYGYTLNGGTVATVATATVSNPNQMALGQLAGGSFLNGHIRQIAYYPTRLTNATLQTLTAPPLVTTLSMSFTDQAYTVGV